MHCNEVVTQLEQKLSTQSALFASLAEQVRKMAELPRRMEQLAGEEAGSRLLVMESRVTRAVGRIQALKGVCVWWVRKRRRRKLVVKPVCKAVCSVLQYKHVS